jgi:hypothetical protein
MYNLIFVYVLRSCGEEEEEGEEEGDEEGGASIHVSFQLNLVLWILAWYCDNISNLTVIQLKNFLIFIIILN